MFVPAGYANISFQSHHVSTGQEAITSIGVHLEDADLGDVAFGAAGAWIDNISPIVGEEWGNGVVRVSLGTSDPSAPVVVELPFDPYGGNTNDTAPPQVATLFRKLTMTGGRKGKGRMYVVGPAEDGIDGAGNFSSSQHADNQSRITDFATDLAAVDGVDGLFLFHTDPDEAPSEIVALVAVQMVATQRRRLRG